MSGLHGLDPVPAKVEYLAQNEWQSSHAYSPAVVTTGGRTIWLAGQTTETDLDGQDIRGDVAAQARTIFKLLDRTLQRTGASLANMVTMTVFLKDVRDSEKFIEVRREFFEHGKYPCSALLTISNFVRPGSVIEIQGVAVA